MSLLIYDRTSPCISVRVSQPCRSMLYKTQLVYSPSLMTIPRDFGPFMSAAVDQPNSPSNEPEITSETPWGKKERPGSVGERGERNRSLFHLFSLLEENSHCDSSPGSMV